MFRPAQRRRFGLSEAVLRALICTAWLTGLLLVTGCATATTSTGPPEAARSHVYPLPLDNVFAQTTTVMQRKGWAVKRAGNVLVTNWHGGSTETLVSYRIFGQRIAAGLSAIRVERLVATTSTSFNMDHPVSDDDTGAAARILAVNQNFVADDLDDSAGGTAPPAGTFSPSDLARPSPWVVSSHRRDVELEGELQREIDPTPVVTAEPKGTDAPRATETPAGSGPQASPTAPATPAPVVPHLEAVASTTPKRPLADLAGIWEGTFNFRGNVTGSFTGEISVSVEDGVVEVADFCPERGGTLTAEGSGESASWQGELACPPIPVKGCTSSVIRYNSASATLQGDTLVLVAAGNVETPAGCGETSGAMSTTFVAQKADYLHITVTRAKGGAACAWPSDWEDLGSVGSMAMPESSLDNSAYLGIIRAKGVRLTDIQRLLRHCRHLVLLHGQPVLMHLTATRSRP
jgi:hypothetical protein